jgi:lipid A 4'-phosphatase
MNRAAILIVTAVAVATGLLLGFDSQLDLDISARFFDPTTHTFMAGQPKAAGVSWAWAGREAANWIVTALGVPAAVVLIVKLIRPAWRLVIPARAAALLVSTLLLGPGLVTNVVLKDHWGRPRPVDVREFGGAKQFVPWWDPGGRCLRNCSFVAGEGAGAFWTVAPATLAPAPVRALAYAFALTFAVAVGMLRIAFGAHFLTDVVFSGTLTFAIIWVVHGALYRWPKPELSDAALESAIEHLVLGVHAALAAAAARLVSSTRRMRRHPGSNPPF